MDGGWLARGAVAAADHSVHAVQGACRRRHTHPCRARPPRCAPQEEAESGERAARGRWRQPTGEPPEYLI